MVTTNWHCRCTAQHQTHEVGWRWGQESYQSLMSHSHWGGSIWWWWWWTESLPQWQRLCRWGCRTGQQWKEQLERWWRHQLWLWVLQEDEEWHDYMKLMCCYCSDVHHTCAKIQRFAVISPVTGSSNTTCTIGNALCNMLRPMVLYLLVNHLSSSASILLSLMWVLLFLWASKSDGSTELWYLYVWAKDACLVSHAFKDNH